MTITLTAARYILLKFTLCLKGDSKSLLINETGRRWDIMTANDESNPSSAGLGG